MACGEKEQGFAARKYDLNGCSSKVVECGDFVAQMHKRRKCRAPTLSFVEQAYTFAVGEQKLLQKYLLWNAHAFTSVLVTEQDILNQRG